MAPKVVDAPFIKRRESSIRAEDEGELLQLIQNRDGVDRDEVERSSRTVRMPLKVSNRQEHGQ